MEDQALKERCDTIIENMRAKLHEEKQCIAAYLLGSASHDKVWKWSDIQIEVVMDDGYKGKQNYTIYEDGMYVVLNVHTLTNFKEFIGVIRVEDHIWKAFSKCTKLFSKDLMLDELLEEAFYIGEIDAQKEMLLGFSGAVYNLNKAEKNLYVKENMENAIYFIPQIVENIAWIEIFKNRQIPERELIAQGKKLNGDLFEKIYDPLFAEKADYVVVKNILDIIVSYLEENTREVYKPVLSHLERHGNLEQFRYETRPHGFGINYEWLVRCDIVERYGIPEKCSFLKQAEKLGYRMK